MQQIREWQKNGIMPSTPSETIYSAISKDKRLPEQMSIVIIFNQATGLFPPTTAMMSTAISLLLVMQLCALSKDVLAQGMIYCCDS